MTTFTSHGITQVEYTIWWHRGDEPGQETTMYAPLGLDYEELEEKAKSAIFQKYRSTRGVQIDNIVLEYDRDAMAEEIRETIKKLDRYADLECSELDDYQLHFYDENDDLVEVYDVAEAVEIVINHYEETGNMTAEIRYDGLKFFTQEVIF